MFGDAFFKKVENKSGVNKETILSLASKLQKSNMKDEKVLHELVQEISGVAGKEITKENGRHRNDGNDDNRLFTRGTNYPCGQP